MHLSVFALLGLLAVEGLAAPAVPHVLHEKRDKTSRAWIKRSRLEGKAKLPMRIGLTQSNLETGHDILMDM